MSAKADYNIAKKNFEYATITSPVSGTVISKEIEQGQTVAASFETPTLFEVAEDLSKMQIEASVSEADIGYIKPDMHNPSGSSVADRRRKRRYVHRDY